MSTPYKFNLSLRQKVVLSVMALFLAFHAIYTYAWARHQAIDFERRFTSDIISSVNFVVPPLALSLWEFDQSRVERTLAGLGEDPDYLFSQVISAGEVFAQQTVKALWDQEWDVLLEQSKVESATPTWFDYGDIVIVAVRIYHKNGSEVGHLATGFSRDHFNAITDLSTRWAILTGLASALIFALVFFFLASHITAPLVVLAQSVRRFSSGEAMGDLPYSKRSDEIGDLSRAFDMLQVAHKEARTDDLTGLPNRRALDDMFAGRNGFTAISAMDAFGIVDLDEFKPVNDNFGHEAGDYLLIQLAERMTALLGASGEVLRLGGDEFGVLWRDIESRRGLIERGEQMVKELSRPVDYLGEQLFVGASIGAVLMSDINLNSKDALFTADGCMYAAKHRMANKIELFDPEVVTKRLSLRDRREIESALDQGQFEACFQPQVNLVTGKLIGLEALARWRTEDRGVLFPDEFMPKIDELQMQNKFDLFIVNEVLQQVRVWREMQIEPKHIAINLCEETLVNPVSRDELLGYFDAYSDCLPWITLEITEDAFIDRSAEAIRQSLKMLFNKGLRISMDDFGTGYGSFRHIREYKFHELKIDKNFVIGMLEDKAAEIIVKGFISIAQGLGADVVAEGVETSEQADKLVALGCIIGQGYYFSRPLAADQATSLMLNDTRLTAVNS